MTPVRREVLNGHLHWVLAALAVWLVATSPWVSMLRRFPSPAGFFDYAHVVLGWIAFALGLVYAVTATGGGRLRQFLPGKTAAVTGVIEGLLLLTLIITGVTGALWFLTQGTADALAWRSWHTLAARVFVATAAAHLLAVAAHVLDL
jgi:hypothetical protein